MEIVRPALAFLSDTALTVFHPARRGGHQALKRSRASGVCRGWTWL